MKKLIVDCWMLCWCIALVLFAVASGDTSQTGPLIYQLVEEQPPGTFIADIRQDSGISLPAQSSSEVTFSLLIASAHFHIDPDTGELSTSDVIDRDVLCPGQSVCQLPADVVVRPVMYFRKVIVEIVDLNDNSPAFPRSHSTVYVSEATLAGQLLFPVQSAYDVDSPRYGVVGYRLIESSTAATETFQLTVDSTEAGGFDVRVVLRQPLDRERRSLYQIEVSRLLFIHFFIHLFKNSTHKQIIKQ